MRWNFLREKAVFMMFIIVCAIFTVNLAIPVNAEDEEKACCELTKFGEQCRYTETENCNLAYTVGEYQTCEDTSFCKLGCCVSPEGLCSAKVSKAVCEGLQDYEWNPDENCAINECNKGCCVLAESQCKYTTDANCDTIMRGYPDIDKDFRMVTGEIGCRDVCRAEEEGCCIMSDTEYVYTTRQVCGAKEFFPEKFCSTFPESGCKAKDSKKCVDFDEDVYWFDSCGNKEEKAEDCDYLGGTLCGVDGDEAKCGSVDCSETYDSPVIDYDGVSRFNGESWCEYESATGTGLDLVGSQHYRRMCLNGEEIVDTCRDYRQEICIQADALNGPQGTYREASCAPNNWQDCQTVCNSVKEVDSEGELDEAYRKDEQCCDSLSRTCAWIESEGAEDAGVCLPLVSPGFKIGTESNTEAMTACEISKIEEKAAWYYAIDTNYDWQCNGNCFLYDQDFLENINQLCKSAGDCGADYNVLGKFTNEGLWRKWQGTPQGDPEHTLKAIGDYNERRSAGLGLYIGEVNWLEMMAPIFDYQQKGKMEIGHVSGDLFVSGAALLGAAVLTYLIIDMVIKGGFLVAIGIGTAAEGAAGLATAGGASAGFGWAAIALAAVAIVLIVLASLYDTETREVTVECTPWVAPPGGSDCEKCDEMFTECGQYKCESLGRACKYLPENEGTDRPKCVAVEDNDPTSPRISAHRASLSQGYTLKETEGVGYSIKPEAKPYKKFSFGIVTNKVSTCKIDTDYDKDRTYSDMAVYFPDQTKSKIHNMSVVLSPTDEVIKYYVMCEDANGNQNTKPYVIELEVGEGRDIEAPVIEGTNYASESYVNSETTEVGIELYVDEPSTCKWSTEDTGYEIMQNDLKCAGSAPDPLFNAQTTCYTLLNLTEDSNTYYFKCQDQVENTNADSFALTLHKTQPLLITQLEPSGELYTKDVVLQVLTSSGAENGKAVCATNGYNFFETNSTVHQQSLQNLPSGFYQFPITCQDIAGNLAQGEINFTIAVDESYPLLTSLYKQGDGISIKLNEIANCQYSSEKFTYGTGTSMGENTVLHSATGSEEYHIICQDIYGNIMPEVVVYI